MFQPKQKSSVTSKLFKLRKVSMHGQYKVDTEKLNVDIVSGFTGPGDKPEMRFVILDQF